MSNIDLIPVEYHHKKIIIKWFKIILGGGFFLSLVIIGAFLFFRYEANMIQHEIKRMQQQKEISNSYREQLKILSEKKNKLLQEQALLDGLRSGASTSSLFEAINESMPSERIWLTRWEFRRAGTPVDQLDKAVSTGYFIVIPSGSSKANQQKETWKIETKMTLHGQAFDYEELSELSLNLTRRSEIENVRVMSTHMTKTQHTKLMGFTLEVTVSTDRRVN